MTKDDFHYLLNLDALPPVPGDDPEELNEPGTMKVYDYTGDGPPTVSTFVIPQDLQDKLELAQAEWARLKEAGTPYWCIHEGRSVTHPAAYWRDDDYENPIHRKHGVFCRDCGGYIQEG